MTRALGIDIGNHSIKIAELEYTSKSRNLLGLFEVARLPHLDPATQLRDFFLKSQITVDRIAVGISSSSVMMRKMEFPFKDRKKTDPAIRGEWEDILPFEVDGFISESKNVGKIGRNYQFWTGICPESVIENLNHICFESQIQPNAYFVDAEALAQLVRLQKFTAALQADAFAVVDIGSKVTKVAVLSGEQILDLRHIDRGSSEWVDWIAQKRNVSASEAEQWLIHRAEISADDEGGDLKTSIREDLNDDIKSALRPVVVEIFQTLQSAKMKHHVVPELLLVTGQMSKLRGFHAFLERELGLLVQEWSITAGFEMGASFVSKPSMQGFAVALSLATSFSIKKPLGWINFRKNTDPNRKILTETFHRLKNPELRLPMAGLSMGLATVWIYAALMTILVGAQKSAVEKDLMSEFRKADNVIGGRTRNFISDVPRTEETYEQLAKSLLKKEKDPFDAARSRSHILADVSQILPAGVKAKSLNVLENGRGIVVQFKLSDADGSLRAKLEANLKNKLQGLGYSDVIVSPSSKDKTLEFKANWKGHL